jgi:EAL domain-containing protein (putative c-di-GMP-specific phosphodiesterase class I)
MSALPALFLGALAGGLLALITQQDLLAKLSGEPFSFLNAWKTTIEIAHGGVKLETGVKTIDSLLSRGGMSSMLNTVWLIIMAMAFGGIMEMSGMLGRIADAILSGVKGTASLITATIASCFTINVTAADLADPGFAGSLELSRVAAGLSRNRLTLEVTEGAFITDIYGAVELLVGLRADGIKIALDDFGTGYSSLAWMARLPIDVIKLDRSFTLGLTGAPRERVVVETMVRLSKQLGLTVVAEGVEDDVQFDAAQLAGCDAVQGFRVAAPMPADQLASFCEQWQARSGDA